MRTPGKRIAAALLAAVLTVGLAACGAAKKPEETTGFVPALDTATACKIRVVGNYNNFESLEAEFDRFNEFYPNVELSFTGLDSYNDSIVPALSSDDAPNIYCMFPWMVNREQWAELFDAAEDLSDPALHINLGCVREGLLYHDEQGRVPMVPVLSSAFGMLVNEDLFRREGVAIPKTFAELLEACKTLKAAGYESPVMAYNNASHLCNPISHPRLYAALKDDSAAVAAFNALEPEAGELMRPSLELVRDFMDNGCLSLAACEELTDSYQAVILRFFEGDVPMMLTSGDTVSGTAKRESMSEAFMANPFTYSYHPVPVTDEGGYFLNSVSMEFAVNKNAPNLDMANEFMRFLISVEELNEMARIKRLLTTSVDLSLDGVFAAFGEVDAAHTVYEQEIGLLDAAIVQLRRASWHVGNGTMTVDEAVAAFGTLED